MRIIKRCSCLSKLVHVAFVKYSHVFSYFKHQKRGAAKALDNCNFSINKFVVKANEFFNLYFLPIDSKITRHVKMTLKKVNSRE